MSIDLSKVTALSDQYGAWKQVADASGRVIWSAVPPTITFYYYSKETKKNYTWQAVEGMTWEQWIISQGSQPYPGYAIYIVDDVEFSVMSNNVSESIDSEGYSSTIYADELGPAYTIKKADVIVNGYHYHSS